MKESASERTIKTLQEKNKSLQHELDVNINLAKTLAKLDWLSSDMQVALLEAISQVSMQMDELHAKPKRLLFTMRLQNLINNLNKVCSLFPLYLADYQKNYLEQQSKRSWVSFKWYVQNHHCHTGLEIMAAHRDRIWMTAVAGEHGIIGKSVRSALHEWLKNPLKPLPFETVFLDVVSDMKDQIDSIIRICPKVAHVYNDSYEAYLLALSETMQNFEEIEKLCDKKFTDTDCEKWFQHFYVDAYRGTKMQPATQDESRLNEAIKYKQAA